MRQNVAQTLHGIQRSLIGPRDEIHTGVTQCLPILLLRVVDASIILLLDIRLGNGGYRMQQ